MSALTHGAFVRGAIKLNSDIDSAYNHVRTNSLPRDGWEFVRWVNCFSDQASAVDQCGFNVPASLVRASFGKTVASLVAEFQQLNPPPVALYSYAIDSDGALIDPMPQITDNEIDDSSPTINKRGTIGWRTM